MRQAFDPLILVRKGMRQEHYAVIECVNCKFGCTVGPTETVGELRIAINAQANACIDKPKGIISAYIREGTKLRPIEMRL